MDIFLIEIMIVLIAIGVIIILRCYLHTLCNRLKHGSPSDSDLESNTYHLRFRTNMQPGRFVFSPRPADRFNNADVDAPPPEYILFDEAPPTYSEYLKFTESNSITKTDSNQIVNSPPLYTTKMDVVMAAPESPLPISAGHM